MVSYPRRQQLRRLRRAVTAAAGCGFALGAAVALARAGERVSALAFLTLAVVLGAVCRRWLRLAQRSAVGAHSEAQVRRELGALEREGWTVRHSLRWACGGDIDHVAIAPAYAGVAFAVETKTATYTPRHLQRTVAVARWLERRRRGWCPHGAIAVLCVVRARRVETWQDGVLVVSPDRLVPALRILAGTLERPAFLAGE